MGQFLVLPGIVVRGRLTGALPAAFLLVGDALHCFLTYRPSRRLSAWDPAVRYYKLIPMLINSPFAH